MNLDSRLSEAAPTPGSTKGGQAKSDQHSPILIDGRQAAHLLGVSERTLQSLASSGTVPSRKIGHLRRYVVAELHTWVDGGCQSPRGEEPSP